MRSSPRRFASIARFIVHYFLFLFNSRRVFICIPRLQRRQRHFFPLLPPEIGNGVVFRRLHRSPNGRRVPQATLAASPCFCFSPLGRRASSLVARATRVTAPLGKEECGGGRKTTGSAPSEIPPFSYTPLGFFLLPFPTYPFFLWSPFASNLPSSSFPTHSPVLGKENS